MFGHVEVGGGVLLAKMRHRCKYFVVLMFVFYLFFMYHRRS